MYNLGTITKKNYKIAKVKLCLYSAGTLPAIELSSHSAMDIGSMQSPNVARNIMKADGITQSPDRVCVGFVLLQIVPKEDTFLLLLDDSLHLQIICHL